MNNRVPILSAQSIFKSYRQGTENIKILNGASVDLMPGDRVAIVGRSGSGKSTLSYTLAGKPNYIVDSGDILFEDQSIIEMLPETRAQLGIFLSFQHPLEIAGVHIIQFKNKITTKN